MSNPDPKQPTVKLTPDFKVGETIVHKFDGTEHTILSITPEGNLECSNRIGLMPPNVAAKKV